LAYGEGVRDEAAAAAERERQRALREQILRIILTSEARLRLNNIRMVRPDQAQIIEDQLIQLAQAGKINRRIGDEELKRMLASLQQPKREFKIRWA
jgi:programmed cell death protein 5